FDTTIVVWLSWSRTRALAFAAVVLFHVATRMLFPIGMFPVIMIGSALVFFPPSWPRHARGWLLRRGPIDPARSGHFTPQVIAITRRFRLGAALGGLYLLVQIALPLRSHLYPGNVLWHEQGMRFSWRVMVREKNGSVTFHVTRPDTGRHVEVSPRRYLNDQQAREMAGQPDLLLQLAHRIRDDHEQLWQTPVEVHVDALVSLNGRRGTRLVDPEVDLARVEDGFGDAPWILPAPAGPPPHIRPVR
ncbi:MAG: HTTM domain-containing protein, partial [Deltaproteobacteria bacterium]|nr:HTTM domain-containing protein [Nannocystaceae bacterium]